MAQVASGVSRDPAHRRGAGVVDEDIDAAEGLARGGHCTGDVVRLGHVAGTGNHAPAGVPRHLLRRRRKPLGVARDDDDMRLLAREFGGNGTTDADAAAGHDGNLAAQVQIHDATLTR
ncbi:hypothetical protein ABIF90_003682 [Bradyrhizobium japonicum]